MAATLSSSSSGLTPAETSFLAEHTLVTIVPRQALASLPLISGPTPALRPPHRATIPLWLALLLKRQDRANILPPPWLAPAALEELLGYENSMPGFAPAPGGRGGAEERRRTMTAAAGYDLGAYRSATFRPECTDSADAETLPYHWLEVAQLLLEGAADDVPDADGVRRLLRDLRETRAAKLRKGVEVLEGGRNVVLDGVGGLEVSENRAFVCGVVDGLRKIGASKEAARREREAEEREAGYGEDSGDEDML